MFATRVASLSANEVLKVWNRSLGIPTDRIAWIATEAIVTQPTKQKLPQYAGAHDLLDFLDQRFLKSSLKLKLQDRYGKNG